MDIPITFNDFKTEENFLTLQNKYSGWDCKKPPKADTFLLVVKNDFSITYKGINLLTGEDDYQEMYFYKEFLYNKIQILAKSYILFFKRHIKDKLLLDKDRIELYSKIQLKKIIEIEERIKNAEYLNKNVKNPLLIQLDIVIEYLKQIHILPNYSVEDKFKMNMNKTDIILLFTLLRQNKNIDSIKDSHLGFLIEKSFLYKNGEGYTPIKRAGKVVNDVKHFNRTTEKAIERLKRIFMKNEFYDLEIH